MMIRKMFLLFIFLLGILILTAACKEEQSMNWESNYVVANDVKFHFTRTGYNKPLIVAVHGITDNGLCWSSVAKHLNADYDFLMLDARGHGLSDAPAWGYDLDTYMEDIVQVLKKLSIRNPILLGHSLGAITVTMLASRYPGLPRAIILEDPVGIDYRENTADTTFIKQQRLEIQKRNKLNQEELIQLCRTEVHPNWPSIDDVTEWAVAKQQVSPEVAVIFGQIGGLVEYFPSITCPVLILKADADDAQRTSQSALFQKITNHKLIYISGAGHNIRREKFDIYMQHLGQFLNSL
jgi:pimeloyl-ACP methyl ester carboxylesterase